MSDNKTIDNVHVHIYGHEMLGEVISRARKNNIPYDKEMKYDFHSHGHSYLVFKYGELTLLEDPLPKHNVEVSLNDLFELYLSKEEGKPKHQIGKWYKHKFGMLFCVTSINENGVLYGYGFDKNGSWFSSIEESSTECACNDVAKEYTTEATPQEVEQALIEEAKRRYKIGDVIKCFDKIESEVKGTAFVFYNNCLFSNGDSFGNSGWFNTSGLIFKEGQWATIIEQDKFAKLKEAHKKGAKIQFRHSNGEWIDINHQFPTWQKSEYRIKPEEKPKVGDVCKFWDNNEDDFFIAKLHSISDGEFPYTVYQGYSDFMNAKTLIQQEAIELLFPNK